MRSEIAQAPQIAAVITVTSRVGRKKVDGNWRQQFVEAAEGCLCCGLLVDCGSRDRSKALLPLSNWYLIV